MRPHSAGRPAFISAGRLATAAASRPLSSEPARQACCFATKQASSPALLVVVRLSSERGTPGGTPGLLRCQEAGVSPCAPDRRPGRAGGQPCSWLPLARAKQAPAVDPARSGRRSRPARSSPSRDHPFRPSAADDRKRRCAAGTVGLSSRDDHHHRPCQPSGLPRRSRRARPCRARRPMRRRPKKGRPSRQSRRDHPAVDDGARGGS